MIAAMHYFGMHYHGMHLHGALQAAYHSAVLLPFLLVLAAGGLLALVVPRRRGYLARHARR